MIGPLLPYTVAKEMLPGLESGAVEITGALIKNTATGRIVGHVQATGLLHKALAAGAQHAPDLLDSLGPVTGLTGMIQDQRIIGRLDAMQQTLGGLQVLQLAGLATSVIGIGVTVAGTALMLRRLNAVDGAVARVEAKLDDLPRKWTEGKMRDRIRAVGTALSRIDEAGARRDPDAVMKDAERDLHHDFDALHAGAIDLLGAARLVARLVAALLAAMSVCSGAQMKALLWLDEKEAALRRASDQAAKLRQLAWEAPADVLRDRTQESATARALRIASAKRDAPPPPRRR